MRYGSQRRLAIISKEENVKIWTGSSGFSFTDNSDGYAKNLTMSSDQLYDALTQFFAIHGDYEENPFYITGESYAGNYRLRINCMYN